MGHKILKIFKNEGIFYENIDKCADLMHLYKPRIPTILTTKINTYLKNEKQKLVGILGQLIIYSFHSHLGHIVFFIFSHSEGNKKTMCPIRLYVKIKCSMTYNAIFSPCRYNTIKSFAFLSAKTACILPELNAFSTLKPLDIPK